VRRVRPSYHQIGAGRRDLSHAHDDAGDWAITAVAYVAALEKPDTFKRSRALVPGSGLHRGTSSREKWTTTATSRGVVIASCALCFTKLPLCS
jgi:hypothetical protein